MIRNTHRPKLFRKAVVLGADHTHLAPCQPPHDVLQEKEERKRLGARARDDAIEPRLQLVALDRAFISVDELQLQVVAWRGGPQKVCVVSTSAEKSWRT